MAWDDLARPFYAICVLLASLCSRLFPNGSHMSLHTLTVRAALYTHRFHDGVILKASSAIRNRD